MTVNPKTGGIVGDYRYKAGTDELLESLGYRVDELVRHDTMVAVVEDGVKLHWRRALLRPDAFIACLLEAHTPTPAIQGEKHAVVHQRVAGRSEKVQGKAKL